MDNTYLFVYRYQDEDPIERYTTLVVADSHAEAMNIFARDHPHKIAVFTGLMPQRNYDRGLYAVKVISTTRKYDFA